MSENQKSQNPTNYHAISSYLAILILSIFLGLGIWLFLNNNAFRDNAILTPLGSPTAQPAVAGTYIE